MDEILIYFGSIVTIALIEFVLLILITLWTPAWTFIKATLKKERLILHVGEDRYFRIKGTKSIGSMSEIKKQGMYITSPKDTYIEAKSKSPIAICYGKFSLSLTPQAAATAKHLDKIGLQNFDDIIAYYELVKNQRKALKGYVEKTPNGDVYHAPANIPKDKLLPEKFNVLGESVSMEDVVKYFSSTERSDIIEAEIQRRTAAQAANQFKQGGELIKWAAVIMIILIGGAIAYAIISPYIAGVGNAGTSIINNYFNGTTPSTIPSITSNTSLNVTPPSVSVGG